jgi:preprotein translocase subunit SecB
MLSPLQLKTHRFTQLHLEAIPKGMPGDGVQVDTNLTWGRLDAHPDEWRVDLKITFGPTPQGSGPYRGIAEVVGFFQVDERWPADKCDDLIAVNGASMLYGAVREMVLVMSSRSSHGELQLPTLRFSPPSARAEKKVVAKKAAKTVKAAKKT